MFLRTTFHYTPTVAGGKHHQYASEIHPFLHVHLTHGLNGTAHLADGVLVVPPDTLRAEYEARDADHVAVQLDVPFDPSAYSGQALPASSSLVVHAYVETATETGQICREEAGSSYFLLSKLAQSSSDGNNRALWQLNGKEPLVKGLATVHSIELISVAGGQERVQALSSLQFAATSETTIQHFDDVSAEAPSAVLLNAHVQNSLRLFFAETNEQRSAPLSTSDPENLKAIHFPYYATDVAVLPGSAYTLRLPRHKAPASYYQKCLRIALARADAAPEDLLLAMDAQEQSPDRLLPSYRRVVEVMANMYTVYANNLVYMSDEVNTGGNTLVVEKKDNRLINASSADAKSTVTVVENYKEAQLFGGGDCEDSAKSIFTQVDGFMHVTLPAPRTPTQKLLVRYQQLMQRNVFVPALIGAGVRGAKLETTRDAIDAPLGGHTFHALIPTAQLVRALSNGDGSDEFAGLVEAVRSTEFSMHYERVGRRPFHRELGVLVGEGTARATALTLPTGMYYADSKRRSKAIAIQKLRNETQQALSESGLPTSVVSLEMPDLLLDDANGDVAADRIDVSNFYRGVSAFYCSAFAQSNVFDFALAWDEQGSATGYDPVLSAAATHGMHFGKFVRRDGFAPQVRIVPYARWSAPVREAVDDALAQLEPVPAIRRDTLAAATAERAGPPPELLALRKVSTQPAVSATRVLRDDPSLMPLPARKIVLSMRDQDVRGYPNILAAISTAITQNSTRFSAIEVATHYLSDAPVPGEETAVPPTVMHEITLRLASK